MLFIITAVVWADVSATNICVTDIRQTALALPRFPRDVINVLPVFVKSFVDFTLYAALLHAHTDLLLAYFLCVRARACEYILGKV